MQTLRFFLGGYQRALVSTLRPLQNDVYTIHYNFLPESIIFSKVLDVKRSVLANFYKDGCVEFFEIEKVLLPLRFEKLAFVEVEYGWQVITFI